MKYFVFVVLLLSGIPTFAQYVVGNGGYTVHCANSPIKALEIAEAETLGTHINYAPGRTYLKKASQLIARIGWVDKEKANKYLVWLDQWKSQIRWMPELDQYSPHDQGHLVQPFDGCRIRVGIVQTNETRFGTQAYNINPAVWNLLSEDQKAALVLHELIYRDVLEENLLSNSSFVRQVNIKVHSVDLSRERRRFADLIKAL